MTAILRRASAAILIVIAVFAAWTAAKRVMAYTSMFGADRVLAALGDGKKVQTRFIDRAVKSRRRTLTILDIPQARADLGGLIYLQAQRKEIKPEAREALLASAEEALFSGLAAGPGQPFAWMQLTELWFGRRGGGGSFNALLEMTYRVAPNERRVIVPRIRLGFRARRSLSAGNAARIARDVRAMARYQVIDLAQYARREFALPWISENLKSDRALHGKFISAYLRLPPR